MRRRRTYTLPPLHGGYRPTDDGYPSSPRNAADLPKPPKGPGGGSRSSPVPRLPDPGRTESGRVACNEPLVDDDGHTVGRCVILVKRYADGSTKPHVAVPHRVEWS